LNKKLACNLFPPLLHNHPLSPDESEADRVTQTLNSPHPSDSHIPDPELNKTPTREEVKEMLKHLPSDKAAGPDGITNRILQASGEQAIDMIYLYMLIIWEVETYSRVPGDTNWHIETADWNLASFFTIFRNLLAGIWGSFLRFIETGFRNWLAACREPALTQKVPAASQP